MLVSVSHIFKAYGRTQAAYDVTFQFESGKIYGFIGPNGAGKTTTLKILATLEAPTAGDVFFDGVSVVNYPDKVRAIMGYMPDSLPDFSDIQIWEYLDFYARAYGLKGRRRLSMLEEIEEFTNLKEIRSKYLASLSKGMKQRVSLARALIHDPKVLLLDEPAAGLDPRARMDLRNLLKILAGQGKAILLSSHILSELQDICDGAVIIEKGHVLSAGTMEELEFKSSGEAVVCNEDGVSVCIKSLGCSSAICQKLLEDTRVIYAEATGDSEVNLRIKGGDEDIPPVMARLFAAGLPIIGFERRRAELEEIFMKMTSGSVQ